MSTHTHSNVFDLAGHPEPVPGIFDTHPDGDGWRRYSVLMELQVTANTPEEAVDAAMAWRDTAAGGGRLWKLDFDWHLHHPDGC